MIAFDYIYKESSDIFSNYISFSEASTGNFIEVGVFLILLSITIFILGPLTIIYLEKRKKEQEKREKKKILNQILIQKEIEDEIEKQVQIEERHIN